jgi:spore coat protein CotF
MATANIPFNDKERITDALSTQKFITTTYATSVNEAATPEVKACLQSIMNEEHDIAHDLWCEMNTRGWYPVEKADDNKLQTTKNKYATNLK